MKTFFLFSLIIFSNLGHAFVSEDKYSCTNSLAAETYELKILDVGDEEAYVKVKYLNGAEQFFPKNQVIFSINTSGAFFHVYDKNMKELFTVGVDEEVSLLGQGSGSYQDAGDSTGIDCVKKKVSLEIDSKVLRTQEEKFISRPNALALNVSYQPIKNLRLELARTLGKDLKFFTQWNVLGEAHVTTLTPPELKVLKDFISIEEINKIAIKMEIQRADLKIQGLGSGEDLFNGDLGFTYFVIVESKKLLEIREEVEKLALSRGMKYRDFDSTLFFPHITVGYTHEDIHYPIVIKNYEESIDLNFELLLK